MTLDKKQINGLMQLIGLTRDSEINCDQCLDLIAEFAERELAGKSVPEGLEKVEHHLSICSECCEEYRLLIHALKTMNED